AAQGQVLNAGSGFEISIGDTVALIAETMRVEVQVQTDEQRLRPEKSEVERLLADASRLRALTGWAPEYGGLDGFRRGIAKAVQWFGNTSNLTGYKADIYNI
ncbi:MAG: NAD-dependent dehydratase, partial [Janthinobacterium lividum]